MAIPTGATNRIIPFNSGHDITGVKFNKTASQEVLENTAEIIGSGLAVIKELAQAREWMETRNALRDQSLEIIPVIDLSIEEKRAQEVLSSGSTALGNTQSQQTSLSLKANLTPGDKNRHTNTIEMTLVRTFGSHLELRYNDLSQSLDGRSAIAKTAGAVASSVSTVWHWGTTIASLVTGSEAPKEAVSSPPAPTVLTIGNKTDSTVEISRMFTARIESLESLIPEAFEHLGSVNAARDLLRMAPHLEKGGVTHVQIKQDGASNSLNLQEFYDTAKATYSVANTFFLGNFNSFKTKLNETIEAFEAARSKTPEANSDRNVINAHNFAIDERIKFLTTVKTICEVFQNQFDNRKAKLETTIQAWIPSDNKESSSESNSEEENVTAALAQTSLETPPSNREVSFAEQKTFVIQILEKINWATLLPNRDLREPLATLVRPFGVGGLPIVWNDGNTFPNSLLLQVKIATDKKAEHMQKLYDFLTKNQIPLIA